MLFRARAGRELAIIFEGHQRNISTDEANKKGSLKQGQKVIKFITKRQKVTEIISSDKK